MHIQGSAISGSSSDANSLLTLTNNANNSIQINSSPSSAGQIRFGHNSSNYRGAMTYYHSSNILGFTTSGTERVRIDATGTKFSENFSATDDILHINPANGHNRTMELAGDAINVFFTGGTTSTTLRLNEDGGNVQVYNGLGVGVAPNGTAGRIDASNDVVAYSTSDKRLKENIKPLDNALDKVMNISGVSFDWKELTEKEKETIHGNTGHDVGVIAQEIEKVLPEVVTERDNGYKAVKYEKLVPLLIEAIKQQQVQIDELKDCQCQN